MFTEYSLWFLPIILALAFGGTYFQYLWKKQPFFSLKQRNILLTLRFIALFLLLFLFLSPVKHIKHKDIEKPTIIIAQDNTLSLGLTKDSSYYKNTYLQNLDKLCDKLQDKYNVVRLNFGSVATALKEDKSFKQSSKFKDFATNIGSMFDYINENYSNENLSAIVLASDGITNSGDNPLNVCENIKCPIYTVAMGDTTIRKDIAITDIQYNKITFIDDEYPLEVTVSALKANGSNASIYMVKDGKTTMLKHFIVSDDEYSTTVPIKASSHKSGIEKISFYVSSIGKESNVFNNKKDIFIEVLNNKKKILILSSAPHPDIAALRSVMNKSKNYTCDFQMISNIKNNVNDYSMVIFHNLPTNSFDVNIIKNILNKGISSLFIVGQSTNFAYFNSLQTGLTINAYSSSNNQTQAIYNNNFSMFTLTPNTENIIKNLPPLLCPIGKYTASSSLQTLFYQKIGSVSTSYPLIAFNNNGDSKIGIIAGENIWKWRLQNYLINQSFDEVDEIISKTIQLVSNKTDRNRFRVECKDIYNQNEPITFQAELYNDNYELVNTPDVSLNINSKTSAYHFVFGKTSNAYYLNVGAFPQGEYVYQATTTLGKKSYVVKGRFVVNSVSLEQENLVANHNDLFTIASKTSAKMIYPQNILSLEKLIKNNETIKPIIHQTIVNKKFISLWWYWLLIALSLGGEWFLRKYWGRI